MIATHSGGVGGGRKSLVNNSILYLFDFYRCPSQQMTLDGYRNQSINQRKTAIILLNFYDAYLPYKATLGSYHNKPSLLLCSPYFQAYEKLLLKWYGFVGHTNVLMQLKLSWDAQRWID